jgi:hypothetical protein
VSTPAFPATRTSSSSYAFLHTATLTRVWRTDGWCGGAQNSFVGLFNLLGLLGRLAWFTYTVPLYSIFEDQAYTPCIQYVPV